VEHPATGFLPVLRDQKSVGRRALLRRVRLVGNSLGTPIITKNKKHFAPICEIFGKQMLVVDYQSAGD
jgi:hypothetical protein